MILSPAEFSLSAGLSATITAEVKTVGFANKAVTYSITKGDQNGKAKINEDGILTISKDYDTSGDAPQITITATSIYDSSVTGTSTVTVL